MKQPRNTGITILVMLAIIALGLPARMIQDRLPNWYVQYFGDYLWAMLVFFGFILIFWKASTLQAVLLASVFSYSIEVSQLFHPAWLDALRRMQGFGLILGYGFLWSDLAAYTFGITTGALIDHFVLRQVTLRIMRPTPLFLTAAGMAVILIGFVYDVVFAGIPYPDPTPAMSARYAFHSQVASCLRWAGLGLTLCGGVWVFIRRLKQKSQSS